MVRRWRRSVVLACVAAALLPPTAGAAPSTLAECVEGADFIANAASARDNGLARETFLDRLESDFVTIRAFPVALRWFVKDAADERFLRAAAEDVYDRPTAAERHRSAFFAACVSRSTA